MVKMKLCLGDILPSKKKVGVEGVKTGGKNWHAPCRWWERINFFVEYVNTHTHTHTQNSLAAERELTNWDKLMH